MFKGGCFMKNIKYLSMLALSLFMVVSCKGETKPTDLAVEAMERARAAEAEIYASQEYKIAEDLFNQMNDAIENENNDVVNGLAESVIIAANNATEAARRNKSTTLIAQLKKVLTTAQELGLDTNNPDIYNTATQSLIDAENYYTKPDYENASAAAQRGLEAIAPLLEGQEAIALANLNRARELLSRAYRTTDLTQTEVPLTEVSNMIEQAAGEYQNKEYANSLQTSQTAIDIIEELMQQYPSDGTISIKVDPNAENLQLQAYDLIRRLGNTIEFIKENEYFEDVYPTSSRALPLTPLVPAQPIGEESADITNSNVENADMTNSNDEDIEIFLYEEEEVVEEVDTEEITVSFNATVEKLEIKAQNMDTREEVITLIMIEGFYTESESAYNEGNYINAIDLSREGLRLSELYLAGQTLKNHTVTRGNTLWGISGSSYKNSWLWPNIWRANKLLIKDPDLIYPGQIFRIPPAPTTPK